MNLLKRAVALAATAAFALAQCAPSMKGLSPFGQGSLSGTGRLHFWPLIERLL
jgi:hypothetical protein